MQTKSIPNNVYYDKKLKCQRHEVAADGDCGYLAFGVERQQARSLLLKALQDPQHQAKVIALLQPAVEDELLTQDFHRFLQDRGISSDDLTLKFEELLSADQANQANKETLKQELLAFAEDFRIVAGYVDYDIKQKQVQNGWAHVSVLLALAQIRGIALHLWVIDPRGERVPHANYPVYMPEGIEQPERKDLLFINGNHFELIEPDTVELTQTSSQLQHQPGNAIIRAPYMGLVEERKQFEQLVELLTGLMRHTADDATADTAQERAGIKKAIDDLLAAVDSKQSDQTDGFLSLFRRAVKKATDNKASTFAEVVNNRDLLSLTQFDTSTFQQRFRIMIQQLDPRHRQRDLLNGILDAVEVYDKKQQAKAIPEEISAKKFNSQPVQKIVANQNNQPTNMITFSDGLYDQPKAGTIGQDTSLYPGKKGLAVGGDENYQQLRVQQQKLAIPVSDQRKSDQDSQDYSYHCPKDRDASSSPHIHNHNHYHSHTLTMSAAPSVARKAVRDAVVAGLVLGAALGVAGAIFGSMMFGAGGVTGGAIGIVVGIGIGILVGLGGGAGIGFGTGAMSYLIRHSLANTSTPQLQTQTVHDPLLPARPTGTGQPAYSRYGTETDDVTTLEVLSQQDDDSENGQDNPRGWLQGWFSRRN